MQHAHPRPVALKVDGVERPWYWTGDKYAALYAGECELVERDGAVGCAGRPETWARVAELRPPLSEGRVGLLRAAYRPGCAELEVAVSKQGGAPGWLLTGTGAALYLRAEEESSLEAVVPAPPPQQGELSVWWARDDCTGCTPALLSIPLPPPCAPEPVLSLRAENNSAVLGVMWSVILLCYYQGLLRGFWRRHSGPSVIFHSILLQSHMALFLFISFPTLIYSTVTAMTVALCGMALSVARRTPSPVERLDMQHTGGFMIIQTAFILCLLAMGA